MSTWYKNNSQVFVAGDHACWSDADLTKKVRKKRFGDVVQSMEHGLNNMMRAHAADAQGWIMRRAGESSHGDTTEEEEEEDDENGDVQEMETPLEGPP